MDLLIRAAFYYFFGCGHGGIGSSHVEIEFGKNTKTKCIHAQPCHSGQPTGVQIKNIHLT